MSVTVRFFASLREQLGRSEHTLEWEPDLTVAGVWRRTVPDRNPPANLIMAVNQEYAEPQAPVADGDEVAFFPPVTGGGG